MKVENKTVKLIITTHTSARYAEKMRNIESQHIKNNSVNIENIKMVSATQPIDTTTPFGRLIFNLLCDLAEFESDWISQRTRDGLQERRKMGKGKRGPDKIQRKKRKG